MQKIVYNPKFGLKQHNYKAVRMQYGFEEQVVWDGGTPCTVRGFDV